MRLQLDRPNDHRVPLVRLLPGLWYGWQTMPGNGSTPHFTPVRVCSATLIFHDGPLVDLRFLTPTSSHNVELAYERLEVLFPADHYLIAKLHIRRRSRRVAIISELTPAWLARCCPAIAREADLSVSRLGLQQALDAFFAARSAGTQQ